MSEHLRSVRWLLLCGTIVFSMAAHRVARAQVSPPLESQSAPSGRTEAADPVTDLDARETRAMERFLSILEKNPRRGTPLDRVHGYHVERGSLDAFIKSYQDRLAKSPNDGAGWLILGLLEFQRGQDAAAVAALRKAESTRPADPLPCYYLGQALVLVGQPELAADAFERALARKPNRTDLLDIFQALGRVYERTRKTDQALQVWSRLEALFPDDSRVQEQIASALAEENQPALALARFEALAKKPGDPFRQVQLAMSAADLKVRLGKSAEALHDFETMLGKLRPESWLHREVRRKIEEVFLRNDDRAGLAVYYERWTRTEPDDVEALVRLGRTLAALGRAAEARTWYDKAIKLAPTRRDLRLALISQLVQDQKFADAGAEYQALDAADPNNPDTLRDWGALVLKDPSRTGPERKEAAASIWRKMLVKKPDDPVAVAQVADLLRQAELVEPALELYRKAAELAPTNPQYHEYLGEYLHQLKRPAEARAAWAQIAAGSHRSAKSLARLAEVLAGSGFLKEAVAPLTEAIALDATDFDLRLKLADLSHRLEKFDDAETQLAAAHELALKEEEKDAVLESRVKNDQAAGRLGMRIESLRKELGGTDDQRKKDQELTGRGGTIRPGAPGATGGKEPGATEKASRTENSRTMAERWCVLARYLEADGKLPEAVRAANRAVEIEPRSIPAWTLAARLREAAGSLADASLALHQLSTIDRRNRTEHLTGVARLEARLGRIEAALKAGRELLAAAPGNPEVHQFFAQLCFQLGRPEEGVDALRRAVRANPNDSRIVLELAETLAGQYQTEEATEMYWRTFDRAADLDEKLDVVRKLAELYLQRNQLDRLLTRLEHQGQGARPGAGEPQPRDIAMCLAQVYATSGDLGSARIELEKLLATDTRDTRLLAQLSKLSEEEGDLESAARYQKLHEDLAPGDEGTARLADLHARGGEIELAQAIWSRMAAGQSQPSRIYRAMDNLLMHQRALPVADIAESMVRKDPRDWEALYRQGVALATLGRAGEATRPFRELIGLAKSDDEMSAFAKAMARNPRFQGNSASTVSSRAQSTSPLVNRVGAIFGIRVVSRLEPGAAARRTAWSPADFGQARIAALGWLTSLAQEERPRRDGELIESVHEAARKTPRDLHALWNWFYLCALRYDNAAAFAAAKELSISAPTDPEALWAYLHTLGGRNTPLGTEYYTISGQRRTEDPAPLGQGELDHVLACYRSLRTRRPELAEAEVLQNVENELKWAHRTEDADRFYQEAVAGSTALGQIAGAFTLAAERGDVGGLIQLGDRYDRLQTGRQRVAFSTGSFQFAGPSRAMCEALSVCADRKAYPEVLRLVDYNLAAGRRRQERQSAGAAARARRYLYASRGGTGNVTSLRIWVGWGYRIVRITFPQENEYFDSTLIEVLRAAYEIYKRDDLVSDLTSHFRAQATAAKTSNDAIYPRLVLSSILWWNDERDEAVAELTRVVESSRPESDLRLDLAGLLVQQGSPGDAIMLLDAVQPLDNLSLRRREETAIGAALAAGNLDRARQAAERLFGLRLETETQIQLSGQMHQLGLHELADAVLGRARRRAGNKVDALVSLMLQYQRQGKNDQAAQAAMQIMRATTPSQQSSQTASTLLTSESSRTAAMNVLARSGRLPQLIERAREQLAKTPSSVQVYQALADYYVAARQNENARNALEKLIELRPGDAGLRVQVANRLVQSGQASAAFHHYRLAVKQDPLLVRQSGTIITAFLEAGRHEELLALLNEVDLQYFFSSATSFGLFLARDLPNDPKLSDLVVALFRKGWERFPENRQFLLTYTRREAIWRLPDIYDLAREGIIPSGPAAATAYAWYSFIPMIAAMGDSEDRRPVVCRFLDIAADQNRLDELAAQVESARKSNPDWIPGGLLLAMIQCRTGRYDEAKVLVGTVMSEIEKNAQKLSPLYQLYAFWCLGLELDRQPATRDLAALAYEKACSCEGAQMQLRAQAGPLPIERLTALRVREGRPDDARRVLLAMIRAPGPPNLAEEGRKALRLHGLPMVAELLVELGFAAQAVPLYSEALALNEEVGADLPPAYQLTAPDERLRRIRGGLGRVIEQMTPEELAPIAVRAIADARRQEDEKVEAGHSRRVTAGGPAIDLSMVVFPRELEQASIRSMLGDSLAACTPLQRAELKEPLEALRSAHPDDLSVGITIALWALAVNDSKEIESALDRLGVLVEKTPLDPLPGGVRANSRQRASAALQVPLWMVARECLRQKASPKLTRAAEAMTTRALEGARRQTDNLMYLAMIRERGEQALAHGDRGSAEAAWRQMLQTVIAPPAGRMSARPNQESGIPQRPRPGTRAVPGAAPPPASPKAGAVSRPAATSWLLVRRPLLLTGCALTTPPGPFFASGGKSSVARAAVRSRATRTHTPKRASSLARNPRSRIQNPRSRIGRFVSYQPPAPSRKTSPAPAGAAPAGPRARGAQRANVSLLTLERFEQAMQIARLAAIHDAPEVSILAVRDALQSGPPIPRTPSIEPRAVRLRAATSTNDAPIDPIPSRVHANLVELEAIWQAHRMPAAAVYEGLRDVVLPPGRPRELFHYAPPINVNALSHPQSVGRMLASWSVRAGKAEELKKRIAAREGRVMAQLPAAVLAVQVALAAGEPAEAAARLKSISSLLKTDTSRARSELACQAALPALGRPEPELAMAALDVLNSCVESFLDKPEPLATLSIVMARRQFELGRSALGLQRLERYLDELEKIAVRSSKEAIVALQRQGLERVAAECVRAGLSADALAAFGRIFDASTASAGAPPVQESLAGLLRQLGDRPAAEEYATLRSWTMPEKSHPKIRVLTALAGRERAPEVFTKPDAGSRKPAAATHSASDEPTVVSTAAALIDAARRAGTLDQLAEEARSAAVPRGDQKVENAEVLYSLIELARGQGARVLGSIQSRLSNLLAEHESQRGATRGERLHPAPGTTSARLTTLVFPWTDFLLARAAARDGNPALSATGLDLTEALFERAKISGDSLAIATIRAELADLKARKAGAPEALAPASLAHWHPATTRSGNVVKERETKNEGNVSALPSALWIGEAGHVAHLAGAGTDFLLLDYPLSGTFQFSVEAYAGPGEESFLTNQGLIVKPFSIDRPGEVSSIGRHEFLTVPWRLSRPRGFNRMTVQASPRNVRYLVNGHLFHEDRDPSPTCPWLGLVAEGPFNAVWRRFRLEGQPSIPREVRLSDGDRLDGWVSDFYHETQPPRITAGASNHFGVTVGSNAGGHERGPSRSSAMPARERSHSTINQDEYDWSAAGGVIHGRRTAAATAPQVSAMMQISVAAARSAAAANDARAGTEADQSLLDYFRPLHDGDKLTYEFLYEPDSIMVHPALGRLVFLLEPDGVKLHWMTGGSADLSGLPADNQADEPGKGRGGKALPLKPGEWNAMQLAIETGKVTLGLNGQPILERPLEPTLGRQFGFFHYKDQTSARARNVVLRGHWPEVVPVGQQVDWLKSPHAESSSAADRRVRRDLIGESYFAQEADDVIARAQSLPSAERYDQLARWVLATPEHLDWRLAGEFTPSFPAVIAAGSNEASREGRASRVQTGGQLRAPAIELMAAARAAGKLDELKSRIDATRMEKGVDAAAFERGRAALLGLVAIERGDDEAAAKALTAVQQMPRTLPPESGAWMRWPDMVVAARAIARPALRRHAIALLDAMIAEKQITKPTDEEFEASRVLWYRQLVHLRARADVAALAEADPKAARPFGTDPDSSAWARVTHTRAETRGMGQPISHWSARGGVLTHYPGHNLDMMYLAVPLRGDFQLDCELTGSPGRAIAVSYGGLAIFPGTDPNRLERYQLDRRLTDVALRPPQSKIENPNSKIENGWYSFRLSVKGQSMTAFIDGRNVFETRIAAEIDPWLALVCHGDQAGAARRIQISGSPQVPARLSLSAIPELSGWLAGEYGDIITGNDPDWLSSGVEISGRVRREAAGSEEESVLRYNRPMVEDGRIAYEFYYEPGRAMVHPALDRLAFLIEPGGVKVHRLSDGAYERAGTASENVPDEPEKRRGPTTVQLIARAWNRLAVDVTGDRVSLTLNGQIVDERKLDPVNQRSFGLFHFAGQTEVRVRNVVYEGGWPQAVPDSVRTRKSP